MKYEVGQTVTAKRPTCSCRNPSYETFTGTITKVVLSATSVTWYVLDIGKTIKEDWIIESH